MTASRLDTRCLGNRAQWTAAGLLEQNGDGIYFRVGLLAVSRRGEGRCRRRFWASGALNPRCDASRFTYLNLGTSRTRD